MRNTGARLLNLIAVSTTGILLFVAMMTRVDQAGANAFPQVTGVWVRQLPERENRVYVHYKVADPNGRNVTISLWLSADGGATFPIRCTSVSGEIGAHVIPGADDKAIWWDGIRDYPGHSGSNYVLRVVAVEEADPQMVLIAPGSFTMGSPYDEVGHMVDEVPHLVTLTRPFYMCDHEVTQAEWQAVMGWNDSQYRGDTNLPVDHIAWFDAVEFCNLKSLSEGYTPAYTIAGRTPSSGHPIADATVTWNQGTSGYRLPTEAEWEYVCRAGTQTAFANGGITNTRCSDSNLDLIGWYCGNSGGTTHPVRSKAANAWNVYDMHGNEPEWCWDYYVTYLREPMTDPIGPGWAYPAFRVMRNCTFGCYAELCRSARRMFWYPDEAFGGLRVARTAP